MRREGRDEESSSASMKDVHGYLCLQYRSAVYLCFQQRTNRIDTSDVMSGRGGDEVVDAIYRMVIG
jgi:hypothetical protein